MAMADVGRWLSGARGKNKQVASLNSPDSKREEQVQCVICLDNIICRGKLSICDHTFCFGCIREWAKNTNRCPLCKQKFRCIKKLSLLAGGSPPRTIRVEDKEQREWFDEEEEPIYYDYHNDPALTQNEYDLEDSFIDDSVFHESSSLSDDSDSGSDYEGSVGMAINSRSNSYSLRSRQVITDIDTFYEEEEEDYFTLGPSSPIPARTTRSQHRYLSSSPSEPVGTKSNSELVTSSEGEEEESVNSLLLRSSIFEACSPSPSYGTRSRSRHHRSSSSEPIPTEEDSKATISTNSEEEEEENELIVYNNGARRKKIKSAPIDSSDCDGVLMTRSSVQRKRSRINSSSDSDGSTTTDTNEQMLSMWDTLSTRSLNSPSSSSSITSWSTHEHRHYSRALRSSRSSQWSSHQLTLSQYLSKHSDTSSHEENEFTASPCSTTNEDNSTAIEQFTSEEERSEKVLRTRRILTAQYHSSGNSQQVSDSTTSTSSSGWLSARNQPRPSNKPAQRSSRASQRLQQRKRRKRRRLTAVNTDQRISSEDDSDWDPFNFN